MVVKQFNTNYSAHAELREAFILLHSRGYKTEAETLYYRLIDQVSRLPDQALFEDYQRTLGLADISRQQPENLMWLYHWTVSNEMEKRSAAAIQRALRLAREK